MINCLRLGEVNDDIEVGLDLNKGFSIAEDFVMARYYMYVNVYFHKATRSAELIIDKIFERASELAKEGKTELPEDLHVILKELEKDTTNISLKDTVNNYLNLTDNTMWHYIWIWSKHSDQILSDLCARLIYRNFFKTVSVDDILDFYIKAMDYYRELGIPDKYYLLRDQASSSSYKDPYILQKTKSEGKEEESEREASEQIFLFDEKGNVKELSNISGIISQIRNKKILIERVFLPNEHKTKLLGG